MPARCVVLRVRCSWPVGTRSPVCPLGVLCCVCSVLGHLALVHRCVSSVCCVLGVLTHLAPVHRSARSVCRVLCAVSLATWLLFTGVHAWCDLLGVRFPLQLDSCSPVCMTGVSCPHCPWSLGSRPPWCTLGVLCVQCPWPLSPCSPVCQLAVLCCVCGVVGHLAPFHRCARSVCCVA